MPTVKIRFLSHGEQSPSRGPLFCFLESFGEWLTRQGYAASTRCMKLNLIKRFSQWLGGQHLPLAALNDALIKVCLCTSGGSAGAPTTLSQLLVWLRKYDCISVEQPDLSNCNQASQISMQV